MTDRDIIKIAVTPEAKASIEATGERYGMRQIELASRVYTWFAAQDEVVQAAILGILPAEVTPDVARLLLERMAESDPARGRERGAGASAGPSRGDSAASGSQGAERPRRAAKPTRRAIHVTKKPPDAGPPLPPPKGRRS